MSTTSSYANNQTRVIPPDWSLKKKLGSVDLAALLSPDIIEQAQNVITQASDICWSESVAELKKLEQALTALRKMPPNTHKLLQDLIATSFALKSKAGIGGFDLVAKIAASLLGRCEILGDECFKPVNLALMNWHVESIKGLLNLKVKGAGGPMGDAILAELSKVALAGNQNQPMIETSITH